MRRISGSLTIADQITLGLIEGVQTLLGFIVIVFPLALWAVPQHGILANTIFYIVLSTGCGSFIAYIGLAFLKSYLLPDHSPDGMVREHVGGKARMQAYLTWDKSQEDAYKIEKQLRSVKASALHDFGYMVRIASFLSTVVVILFLGTWAFMDFVYGSSEVLSAEERYQLYKGDWGWKR